MGEFVGDNPIPTIDNIIAVEGGHRLVLHTTEGTWIDRIMAILLIPEGIRPIEGVIEIEHMGEVGKCLNRLGRVFRPDIVVDEERMVVDRDPDIDGSAKMDQVGGNWMGLLPVEGPSALSICYRDQDSIGADGEGVRDRHLKIAAIFGFVPGLIEAGEPITGIIGLSHGITDRMEDLSSSRKVDIAGIRRAGGIAVIEDVDVEGVANLLRGGEFDPDLAGGVRKTGQGAIDQNRVDRKTNKVEGNRIEIGDLALGCDCDMRIEVA